LVIGGLAAQPVQDDPWRKPYARMTRHVPTRDQNCQEHGHNPRQYRGGVPPSVTSTSVTARTTGGPDRNADERKVQVGLGSRARQVTRVRLLVGLRRAANSIRVEEGSGRGRRRRPAADFIRRQEVRPWHRDGRLPTLRMYSAARPEPRRGRCVLLIPGAPRSVRPVWPDR